jgi:hypothetical protein
MSSVTKLSIDDEDFLVSSLIDRCPRVMMLRELYQNALEAAAQADGPKEVRIGSTTVDGVQKLRIWNTGPGMDPVALYKMCDLSSSIGKLKGIDLNFGIGAKVASLPSNHWGVRYRSCTRNRAYEIIIGKRGEVYGRIVRANVPSQGSAKRALELVDVSSEVIAEGGSLDFDWTEVVLLGMRADHNTCVDPYDREPLVDPYWAPEYLFRRYFRTNPSVVTLIEPGMQRFDDTRKFTPLSQRGDAYARSETVETENGVKIHFYHDPAHPERSWENKSSESAIHATVTLAAVAWRGEFFDLQRGSSWFYEAPRYGLTFGSRHLNVIIELPDEYPVIPEMYRQFIHYRSSTQGHVRTSDFAPLVRTAAPQWVRQLAQENQSDDLAEHTESFVQELKILVTQTGFARQPIACEPEGDETGQASGRFELGVLEACGIRPVFLRDAQDVRDRWLEGRAAVYYAETAQVFINMLYDSRRALEAKIKEAAGDIGDGDNIKNKIERIADIYYIRRILRSLVHGLAKANNTVNWRPEHIVRATSPEALSTAADDLDELVPIAVTSLIDSRR